MSTARRIKAEYAEKAKIRSKNQGFALSKKMRFRQSASELAVHDNAFEKAVLTIGTGSVTAGIILCLIVKPIRQTVKKKDKLTYAVLVFLKTAGVRSCEQQGDLI